MGKDADAELSAVDGIQRWCLVEACGARSATTVLINLGQSRLSHRECGQ